MGAEERIGTAASPRLLQDIAAFRVRPNATRSRNACELDALGLERDHDLRLAAAIPRPISTSGSAPSQASAQSFLKESCPNELCSMTLDSMNQTAKQVVDTLSVGALVATLLDRLPQVTAVAVFLWTCLRIYESILTIRAKRQALRGDDSAQRRW